MDSLDWECYPVSSLLNYHDDHQLVQAFTAQSNAVQNVQHVIFNQIQHLHKITCTTHHPLSQSHQLHCTSNHQNIRNQMDHYLAPSHDSIIVSSNSKFPFTHTDHVITTLNQSPEFCSSKRPYNVIMENTLSDLMAADFGMPNKENNAFQSNLLTNGTTASLGSLDCLLSATNNNTDTCVEDDGINSIFFSDNSCKNVLIKSILPGVNKGEVHENSDGKFPSGFSLITSNPQPQWKKRRTLEKPLSSSNISFQQPSNNSLSTGNGVVEEPDSEAMAQMKEMIYRAAAFRPVNLIDEVVEKPKRKNVKISSDPQTAAARQRRERISEKMRILQRLVPGGTKMDTATMLDEAANYLNFLRSQVRALETLGQKLSSGDSSANSSKHPVAPFSMQNNIS